MKRLISTFLSAIILFSCYIPASASSLPQSSNFESSQDLSIANDLEKFSTPQLLESFRDVSVGADYYDGELILYISEIVSRISDFSDEELISMIANNSDEANFRRGLLEGYLFKYDFEITDSAFVDMLRDTQFDNGMKILIIVCLDDSLLSNLTVQNVLASLSDSPDGEVAYHAIKALAKGNEQRALEISNNILQNISSESDEKINIALNLFAENYPNVTTIDDFKSSNFINYLCDLYQTTDSEEIRTAIQTSLTTISTQEASLALEYLQSITPQVLADGVGGYIAYRDGVQIIGDVVTNWHAAIAVSGAGTSAQYAQATGKNSTTGIVDYNTFMNGPDNNFLGYYQPRSVSFYHSERDAVVSTAKRVANLHIPYVATTCITYDSIPLTQTHYSPSDIKAIRCDGFVEYCLEYNGIRVHGNGSYWDITLNDSYTQDVHFGVAAISPKSQAEKYMVKVDLN